MKKTFLARAMSAVLAAVCIASFGGCGKKDNMEPYTPSTAFAPDDQLSGITAQLVNASGFTDTMVEQDSEFIPFFFGFVSSGTSGSLYCGESSAQLVAVLKAADGMELRLERTLISHMKRKISSADSDEEKAMMESYVLKSSGGYVILVVSPDADAAEAAAQSAMTELGAN